MLDYLECLTKLEVIWDVSLTLFSVYLAFHTAKRIHHSPYFRVTGKKIDPLNREEDWLIHQILFIRNFVMEKTLDLSEHVAEFLEVKERYKSLQLERKKSI